MLQRLAAAVDLVAEVHYVPVAMIGSLADLRRHRPSILAVCERHGASSPRVFGSVLGRRFGPESDIDLVVDLEPGRTLFDMAGLHDDLTELLGREVDVLTSGSLHGRMSHVAVEAVPL